LPDRSAHSPQEAHLSGSVETLTYTNIAALTDPSAASIVIDVADEPVISPPAATDGAIPLRTVENIESPSSAAPSAVVAPPSQPPSGLDSAPAELPIVRHAPRRQRHRRQQLNTAIFLLAAVIVLALILIWVLQRGASQAYVSATGFGRPIAELASIQQTDDILQVRQEGFGKLRHVAREVQLL
jgi:hypothetical protein